MARKLNPGGIFPDTLFTVYDNGNSANKVHLELSGVSGTVVLAVPNASGTIALTSDLVSGYQPLDADLTTIAGLTATTDNFMVATASAWASRTPAQARTQLGIDTLVVPTGTVTMYGGSAAPTGWLLCDGSSQLRSSFAALFAIIGTTFGSVDGTHFTVPDLRDRFPVGLGVDTANDALGETGGSRNVTLTSAQSGIVAHNHGVGTLATSDPGGHTHQSQGSLNTSAGSGTVVYTTTVAGSPQTTTSNGSHTHTVSGSVASNSAADAGSSHTNMPPFLTLNYIIKT